MITISGSFSGYSVDDLAAAATFYRDVLGLEVTDAGAGLDVALPVGRVFLYPKGDHEPASFTVLNLEVPDIDAAVDELAAAGVTLERYPGMAQDAKGVLRGKASNMGPDIAWFTDPAGNILSVLAN
jgi:catechol 2,3-dioxygenase-like lactoylglutathione lyase family enzyme